jgi:hypothetical protein
MRWAILLLLSGILTMADYSPKDLARALMGQPASAQDGGDRPRRVPHGALDRPSVFAPLPPQAKPPNDAGVDRYTEEARDIAAGRQRIYTPEELKEASRLGKGLKKGIKK